MAAQFEYDFLGFRLVGRSFQVGILDSGRGESVREPVEQIGDESSDGGVELRGEKTSSVVLLHGDAYGDVFAPPAHGAVSPLFLSCAKWG